MTDSLRDELVALTADLVRFRSTADQPEQLAAVIDYVEAYLQQLPGLFIHRSQRAGKPALVATLRDTCAPALMLNGHLDVVAAEPEQFEPQIRNGRVYGRGSLDMKGSMAVLMRLLKGLAALEPLPDVGVQFVCDEEIGGEHGTGRLISEGWRCGFFIAAEPTDLRICYEQKGGVWLQVKLTGQPGHASRPWDAANPLYALGAGLGALARRFPTPAGEVWQTTVVPTVLNTSGISANQVPAEVTLSIDIRRTSEDSPESLIAALQECFPTATVITRQLVSPLRTSADDPHIQRLSHVAAQVCGQPTASYREHFASDARFYSAAGIPAICFGPTGQGLHANPEWVEIDSLVQFYDILQQYIQQGL